MATFRLRQFSSPDVLRAIKPSRLLRFLEPFEEFFARRGLRLPTTDDESSFDHQSLIDIFMSPSEATPTDLLDALFLVDEMSTHEGMDSLLEAAHCEGLALDDGDEHSQADVAIQIWLLNRDILERKHAEQFVFRPKSFEYYQANRVEPPVFTALSPERRKRLEHELDDWFEEKRRGRRSRVFVYPDEHEVRFLVRHGEPFKREESLTSAEFSSVCYRPLKYDVVVYDRRIGELRINTRLVGEKQLYCRQFGKHLFDDEDCFLGASKYTLEPLREYGADSLACGDIDGIESIVLTEVDFFASSPESVGEFRFG